MLRGILEVPRGSSPWPSNPSGHAGGSTAGRSARFPDRGTAAGACARERPDESCSSREALRRRDHLCQHGGRATLTIRAMRILDRYIVREIFRHAFLGLIVFTFVLFVPQLVRLMELLVRHSGSGAQIAKLFLYIFPGVLIFTIPMAVLVVVLLGLGRISAASQMIGLTALGISHQAMPVPVAVLALTGAIATGTLTLWLGPAAFPPLPAIEATLLGWHASFQIHPRLFDAPFPQRRL